MYRNYQTFTLGLHWQPLKIEVSSTFNTTKGILQECCLSPILFKVYITFTFMQWSPKCNPMGLQIHDSFLYMLLFVDNQVVIAGDHMTRKLKYKYMKQGLEMRLQKMEHLVVWEDLTKGNIWV